MVKSFKVAARVDRNVGRQRQRRRWKGVSDVTSRLWAHHQQQQQDEDERREKKERGKIAPGHRSLFFSSSSSFLKETKTKREELEKI